MHLKFILYIKGGKDQLMFSNGEPVVSILFIA